MKKSAIRRAGTRNGTRNHAASPRDWNDALAALSAWRPPRPLDEIGIAPRAFKPYRFTASERRALTADLAAYIPNDLRCHFPAFLDDLQGVIANYRLMRYLIGLTKNEMTPSKKTLLTRVHRAASALTDALAELTGDVPLNVLVNHWMEQRRRDASVQVSARLSGVRHPKVETVQLVPLVSSVFLGVALLKEVAGAIKPFHGGRPRLPETEYLLLPAMACLRAHFPILFKDGSFKSAAVTPLLRRVLDIAVPVAQALAPFDFPHEKHPQHSPESTSNPTQAKAQLIRRAVQLVQRRLQAEQRRANRPPDK
jgi:hypothetical protein